MQLKPQLILALVITIIISGCVNSEKSDTQQSNSKEFNEPSPDAPESTSPYQPSGTSSYDSTFESIKSQLQLAQKSGGISPESYDEIQSQINELEVGGYGEEKINQLRQMLSQLNVGGQNYPSGNSSQTPATTQQQTASTEPENDNRNAYEILTEKERALLPECSSTSFTRSPVDIEKITGIEPRGSTNPPEHTLASSSTDTYIFVDTRLTEKTVPLYAPADIWITFIRPRYNITSDPEDHVIYYALCKDVYGVIDHLKEFSAEMKEIVANYECKYGGMPGDEKCPIVLVEPVKAGTPLGIVGRLQGNFNFGTWDMRHNNSFAAPQKYSTKALHSTCPFDYYASPLKEQLINLINGKDKNCGTVEYDIAGTAQGEWFYGGVGNNMHGDWFNHLFLGYSNNVPEAAVISVGGVISEPLKWMFAPQNSGTKNVGFQYIKDDRIFCYEDDRNGQYKNYEKGPTGRILIQLVNSTSLKIELQSGTCSGSYSFVNETVYER